MTSETNRVRAILTAKRAELARSIRSQSSHLSVHEGESDLIDQMQSMSSREETVSVLHALNRTLADVNAALDAVDQGSYGTCVVCEEPIGVRRLQTIPWASHCIRCQENLERGQTHSRFQFWDEAA
jgi:DnaK suppressor protein